MPALDHPLIDQFLDALWLEKGLSDNTRVSYRSDLALFNGWLQEHGVSLPDAGRELILDHLAWRPLGFIDHSQRYWVVWHQRLQASAEHRWLRNRVFELWRQSQFGVQGGHAGLP